MSYYIAIDGGGTKTEGIVADRFGTILGRRVVGPSNPNDTSAEEASQVLVQLIRQLIASVQDPAATFTLFAGISGALNHRAEMEAAIRHQVPNAPYLEVGSDVRILLSAELPQGDGACIICGTGSACFLRCRHEIVRIGGWGYLLDSGGSGYDIGRDGLEAVLRAHDGRGCETILTDLLHAHLGAPVWQSITEIYEGGKPLIASCAPLVFAAAEQKDEVATAILKRNGRALAEYIETAHRHLIEIDASAATVPFRVVMGGGISQKQAPLWNKIVAAQVDPSIPLDVSVASHPPVLGALIEAIRLDSPTAGGQEMDLHASVSRVFSETYSMYL